MDWYSFIWGSAAGGVVGGITVGLVKDYVKERIKYDFDRKKRKEEQRREADVQLLNRLTSLLPAAGSIDFVRKHQPSAPFSWEQDLGQLDEFLKVRDSPECVFHDRKIQKKCRLLVAAGNEYVSYLGHNSYLEGSNVTYYCVNKALKVQDRASYEAIIMKLNKLADKVVDAYDSVVKLGKERLHC